MATPASTVVARVIAAPREAVYRAFVDRDAVAAWLPPDAMTATVHDFDAREGGAFGMSLFYPRDDGLLRGKTSADTDTFRGRFARLLPDAEIVWVVAFDSPDPSFAGEMTVTTTLAPAGCGTLVTMRCEEIPGGIDLADNEAGCRSTLQKLAAFLGG